jgi:hypothetical protein
MENKTECDLCGGRGYLPLSKDSDYFKELVEKFGQNAEAYLTVQRCQCKEERLFLDKVGKAIFNADVIKETPLSSFETHNMYIETNRPDFLANFRCYLRQKPLTYFWKMTSDTDLLEMFLGKNEDYDSAVSFAKRPDLLVIQLGHQSYKNIALPGVVFECIKSRVYKDMPTWVINPHDLAFKQDIHHVWSYELERFFGENFTRHVFKPKRVSKSIDNQGFAIEPTKITSSVKGNPLSNKVKVDDLF